MLKQSRRDFVKAGSAAIVYSATVGRLAAQTLKVPLGLQLYSVRELLPKDYDGTLKNSGRLASVRSNRPGTTTIPPRR